MTTTLYLDPQTWDLAIDADGNIATASGAYRLAQDCASAIRTFAGEVWYDTTIGVPYFSQILGQSATVALLKAQFEAAARTVDGVADVAVFITSIDDRVVTGQVQVTGADGASGVANF